MRYLITFLLLLTPLTSSALDCTPFQTWTCDQQGYFNYIDGVPGEVLCGVDYTGWTLHVVEVNITVPGFYVVAGTPGISFGVTADTAVMQMDDCSAGTCIASEQGSGVTMLYSCLDVGTHTFVVASDTTDPMAVVNMGLECMTCVEADMVEFECVHCGTVDDEESSWGSVKSQFK